METRPPSCFSCRYMSILGRCQRIASHNYARIVSEWMTCDEHQLNAKPAAAGAGPAVDRAAGTGGIRRHHKRESEETRSALRSRR